MSWTFIINKPSGDLEFSAFKGSSKKDGNMRRFEIETDNNKFKFIIKDEKAGESFGVRDVAELSPSRVLLRNGLEVRRPRFILCKTEELPIDERQVRSLQENTKALQALQEKPIPPKPEKGRNKRGDKTVKEKADELKIATQYQREKLDDPKLTYEQFASETEASYGLTKDGMEKLIRRVRKRKERGTI